MTLLCSTHARSADFQRPRPLQETVRYPHLRNPAGTEPAAPPIQLSAFTVRTWVQILSGTPRLQTSYRICFVCLFGCGDEWVTKDKGFRQNLPLLAFGMIRSRFLAFRRRFRQKRIQPGDCRAHLLGGDPGVALRLALVAVS